MNMAKEFFIRFIDGIAQKAGLPPERLMFKSVKDNLTIKQPRLEYELSPAKTKRSGKILGITRNKTTQTLKRELYTIEQEFTLTLYSENEAFRHNFCRNFMAHLPKNTNDDNGNFVKINHGYFEYLDSAQKRIGDTVIAVDKSFDARVSIKFYSRFTAETMENLINTVTLKTPSLS